MILTPAQKQAIRARGNVLVIAGAGTGKTRTLVERCLSCLVDNPVPTSVDEILVVTFTEAAASEVRQRIWQRLEEQRQQDNQNPFWHEQLALFESAHIGTLHSFCLKLVRQHFYQLELDPQLSVLAEQEARLLAGETLDALLQQCYEGHGKNAQAVQRLIQTQGRGSDQAVRALVLRLHQYIQSLPDSEGWLQQQAALFNTAEPAVWRRWLVEALVEWQRDSLELLAAFGPNEIARRCANALEPLSNRSIALEDWGPVFNELFLAREQCPKGKVSLWLEPLKAFYADVDFLSPLVSIEPEAEPLAQDWAWVRDPICTLLGLCRDFAEAFTAAKRELGVVDFQDLEQYSLRLLWDLGTNQPTALALQWQNKLRFVFVDEYQDINPAQDRIIQALTRQGNQANRFLVGDVKQSIYRFRLANPLIFRSYADRWGAGEDGSAVPLVENFRSREAILNFINSVFGLLMTRKLGGVEYNSTADLQFGAPAERTLLSMRAMPGQCAELHLLLKTEPDAAEATEQDSEPLAEVLQLRAAEKEARMVARRLRELHAQDHLVWDEQLHQFRPVDWKDMAILLRAPARKAESYAKEFARLHLPLEVAPGGFYKSTEVSDLLSLLQLLDNPLQDLPALAVLHSPLVGLTSNELAEIRLASVKSRFWTALLRWHAKGPGDCRDNSDLAGSKQANPPEESQTRRRVAQFLERFARWRRLARQLPLSRCLEIILAETHYDSWLLTQNRGHQRFANLQRLLSLAEEFDQFQRQGLFRFLQFVEAQQSAEVEPEVAAAPVGNAIRLMSIHQSKGLEFPVVVVADLCKPFNFAELQEEIIIDEQCGLCPHVQAPTTGKRYPSLPYWWARRRARREFLGEELRLLYVAMTRARDTVILSCSLAKQTLEKQWLPHSDPRIIEPTQARSYGDWLAAWFCRNAGEVSKGAREGSTPLLRWFVHDISSLAETAVEMAIRPSQDPDPIVFNSEAWRDLEQRLSWQYPFSPATVLPAKTSVSVLRREASALDDDSALLFSTRPLAGLTPTDKTRVLKSRSASATELDAAQIGSAHHQFLERLNLDSADSVDALRQQALQFEREGRLTREQLEVIDYEALAYFWNCNLGRNIRHRSQFLRRELPFTARFSPLELASIVGKAAGAGLEEESVLVQGVVDLAVIAPEEIWIVDFKTEQLEQEELPERAKAYEPQLRLYAEALSRIYRRPVSGAWLYFLNLKSVVRIGNDYPGAKD